VYGFVDLDVATTNDSDDSIDGRSENAKCRLPERGIVSGATAGGGVDEQSE
jgi:hypothetical protein